MTTTSIPGGDYVMARGATGRIEPMFGAGGLIAAGPFRLPTDPLFYADLTLDNIIVGSRYRVTRHSTGDELATGVAIRRSRSHCQRPMLRKPDAG